MPDWDGVLPRPAAHRRAPPRRDRPLAVRGLHNGRLQPAVRIAAASARAPATRSASPACQAWPAYGPPAGDPDEEIPF